MAGQVSTKRIAISKANAQMLTVLSIAAFISVFCLVASKYVFSQNMYVGKVINAKSKTNSRLVANIKAADSLVTHYKTFVSKPTNALGGDSKGPVNGKDGDNGTLVLDALPDKYDFPALTSSIEKIVNSQGLDVSSLTGTDDQLNQTDATSAAPKPVEMPFELAVDQANYRVAQDLIKSMQLSIRPIVVDKLEISGGGANMRIDITAHTFYQPGKALTITKKVVK